MNITFGCCFDKTLITLASATAGYKFKASSSSLGKPLSFAVVTVGILGTGSVIDTVTTGFLCGVVQTLYDQNHFASYYSPNMKKLILISSAVSSSLEFAKNAVGIVDNFDVGKIIKNAFYTTVGVSLMSSQYVNKDDFQVVILDAILGVGGGVVASLAGHAADYFFADKEATS